MSYLAQLGSLFGSGDTLPWTDEGTIAHCERDALGGDSDAPTRPETRTESIMRLAWALVHSRRPADVHRGVAMLEAVTADRDAQALRALRFKPFMLTLACVLTSTEKLRDKLSREQQREVLYLLAVGYFRSSDYTRSRRFVDKALQVQPNFRQAESLKKMVEDKIAADGMIGIGLAATAVALVGAGVAALATSRRR
eukprot:SM000070S21334  [mRNA]  locus=s70:398476:400013:+ [translate_table: standard]